MVYFLDGLSSAEVFGRCLVATYGVSGGGLGIWFILVWISTILFHREKLKGRIDDFFLNMRFYFELAALLLFNTMYLPIILVLGQMTRFYYDRGDYEGITVVIMISFVLATTYVPYQVMKIVTKVRKHRLETFGLPPRKYDDIKGIKEIYKNKTCFSVQEHVVEQQFLLQQLSDPTFQHHHLSRNDGPSRLVRLEREIYTCSDEAQIKWRAKEAAYVDKYGGPLDKLYVGYKIDCWWWLLVDVIEKILYVIVAVYLARPPVLNDYPKAWERNYSLANAGNYTTSESLQSLPPASSDGECVKLDLGQAEGSAILLSTILSSFMFLFTLSVRPHVDKLHSFIDLGGKLGNLGNAFLGLALSQCWVQETFTDSSQMITGIIFIGVHTPVFVMLLWKCRHLFTFLEPLRKFRANQLVIRNQAKVNAHCRALYTAASHGDVVHLQHSLYRGANGKKRRNAGIQILQEVVEKTASQLHMLARKNVKMTFRDDKYRNALMIAACGGTKNHCRCIRTLLNRFPGEINNRTPPQYGGFTALHFAYMNGCNMAVRTLMRAGADETIKSVEGFTPVELLSARENRIKCAWPACLAAAKRGRNGRCNDLHWVAATMNDHFVSSKWWWGKAVEDLGKEEHDWVAASVFAQVFGIETLNFKDLRLKLEADLYDPEFLRLIHLSDAKKVILEGCKLGDKKMKRMLSIMNRHSGNPFEDINISNNDLHFSTLKYFVESFPDVVRINVSKNAIGKSGAEVIASPLKEHSSLVHLKISETELGESGGVILCKELRFNVCLTQLEMVGNFMTEKCGLILAQLLEHNKVLKILDVSENLLRDEGGTAIANALAANEALTTLRMKQNVMETDTAIAIAKSLQTNKTLTLLDLSHNAFGAGCVKAFAEALSENKTLGEFSLEKCELGLPLEKSGAVRMDDVSDNVSNDLSALFTALSKSNSSLKILNLSGNKLKSNSAKSIASMLENNSGIVSLNLATALIWKDSGGDVGRLMGAALTKNKTIETFVVPGLANKDATEFLRDIGSCTSMTDVDLHCLRVNEESAAALGESLGKNNGLRRINLDDTFSDMDGDGTLDVYEEDRTKGASKALETVVESLARHPNLSYLSLQRNALGYGSDAGKTLANVLKLPCLTHVDLSGNKIDDVDGALIAKALASNPGKLYRLDLDGNVLGDNTGEELIHMIESHPTLQTLNIENSKVSIGLKEVIEGKVMQNQWNCDKNKATKKLEMKEGESKFDEDERGGRMSEEEKARWEFYFLEPGKKKSANISTDALDTIGGGASHSTNVEDEEVFNAAAKGDRQALMNALRRQALMVKVKPWMRHRGVYRNPRHGMKTAVMVAAAHDHELCLRLLIDHRYMLDVHSSVLNMSMTALHYAYEQGCRIPINMLIEAGADPRATDLNGFMPSDYLTHPSLQATKAWHAFLFAGHRGSDEDVRWLTNYTQPPTTWWVNRAVHGQGCRKADWKCAGVLASILKAKALNFCAGPGMTKEKMLQYNFQRLLLESDVEKLDFSNCQLGQSEMECLCDLLKGNKTMKVLDISENHFLTRGCKSISRMLDERASPLQELRLNGCAMDADSLKILESSIENHPTLTTISLSRNPRIGLQEASGPILSQILRKKSLTSVDLSACAINVGMFNTFASSLNEGYIAIDVSTNSIGTENGAFGSDTLGDAGAALAKIIDSNKGLKKLNISTKVLHDALISRLAESIESMKSSRKELTVVIGDSDWKNGVGGKKLIEACKKLEINLFKDHVLTLSEKKKKVEEEWKERQLIDDAVSDRGFTSSSDDEENLNLEGREIALQHIRQRERVEKHKRMALQRNRERLRKVSKKVRSLKFLKMAKEGTFGLQETDPRDQYKGPKAFIGINSNSVETRDGQRGMGRIKFTMPNITKHANIAEVFNETEEGLI
eukprot:g5731.t1